MHKTVDLCSYILRGFNKENCIWNDNFGNYEATFKGVSLTKQAHWQHERSTGVKEEHSIAEG